MSKLNMVCNYCDHRWEKGYVSKYCPKCHDTNIKSIKASSTANIDYYEGSPEFADNTKEIVREEYDNYL